MKKSFGTLPNGDAAFLYTITGGGMTARITDFGATLVSLLVPDREGNLADVVLGYDSAAEYLEKPGYLGCTVGRNANRIAGSRFTLNGKTVKLEANEGENCLHSGDNSYCYRLWQLAEHKENAVSFTLESPNADQGFPGNAKLRVTYTLLPDNTLDIAYDGICDQDTVFNLTNHSYFNLSGHENPQFAMDMELSMPARHFAFADEASIPTGEERPVADTPMDFREPKPIGRDIEEDYDALHLQGGYDHNFEVFCNPCATLHDPRSGRTMCVVTDCPGIQFYSGNFLEGQPGKGGVKYTRRGGIALETQYYPNSVNNPAWKQPFFKAGERYRSCTKYIFR